METEKKYDIIFSNATIQWIHNQEKLISDFVKILNDQGATAVQVPLYHNMPLSQAIEKVSLNEMWSKKTMGAHDAFTFHSSDFYYDILSAEVESINMCETF